MTSRPSAPFRPPHGEDCPICYPHGRGAWLLVAGGVVIVTALLIVARVWG